MGSKGQFWGERSFVIGAVAVRGVILAVGAYMGGQDLKICPQLGVWRQREQSSVTCKSQLQ
jgi:hypothetical protein